LSIKNIQYLEVETAKGLEVGQDEVKLDSSEGGESSVYLLDELLMAGEKRRKQEGPKLSQLLAHESRHERHNSKFSQERSRRRRLQRGPH